MSQKKILKRNLNFYISSVIKETLKKILKNSAKKKLSFNVHHIKNNIKRL